MRIYIYIYIVFPILLMDVWQWYNLQQLRLDFHGNSLTHKVTDDRRELLFQDEKLIYCQAPMYDLLVSCSIEYEIRPVRPRS